MAGNDKYASLDISTEGIVQFLTAHGYRLYDAINALRLAVEQLSPPSKPPADPRRHFYKVFNQEADEYDRDFHKKYHDDLNTTLIFAGLFSAVASAFIIDIQQELRPDYNEMSFTVLTMLLNATSEVPNQLGIPVASGPKASAVQVQSILFSSLASALLAAFLAMLGKQWLNLHVEGSLIDRSRHRELRMRGMITWRFKFIMECLPLIMQVSLLLLGCALARYMWDLSRTVSAAIAAFTVFGFLFYLVIVFAATFWKTCPFQTPASFVFRYILNLIKSREFRWVKGLPNRLSRLFRPKGSDQSFKTAMSVFDQSLDHGESDRETTFSSDTNCISTMLRMASGSDAIVAITRFISEVNWSLHARTIPLLQVYHELCKSFEFLRDGRVLVRPGMKDQAHESAKALLHLRIQRSCANSTDDSDIVASKLPPILWYYSKKKEDHDLDSTLRVIDTVFIKDKPIPWDRFSLSDSHYCWLSNVLRLRAWEVRNAGHLLTKDVRGFVYNAFSKYPRIPARVMADCLLIVDMVVGVPPAFDENLLIKDKTPNIDDTIASIYDNLALAFTPQSTAVVREGAIEALNLMLLMKNGRVCEQNYELFCKVMASVRQDAWLWHPARLSMSGAFKSDFTVSIDDPRMLLDFLHYHFGAHGVGNGQGGPIDDALCVLAFGLIGDAPKEVAKSDFTNQAAFRGLCHALREGGPYFTRRACVFLLFSLDDQLFNAGIRFPEAEARALITGWAHSAKLAVDTRVHEELRQITLTTLMSLLDSPFWREFIPPERWDFLKHVGDLDDPKLPRSFYRCLGNTAVIPHLKQVVNQEAFLTWLVILWTKYPDVSLEVKIQLEDETVDIARGPRRSNIPVYVSIMEEEMERIRKKTKSHYAWSFDQEVVELRARQSNLREARQRLCWIRDGHLHQIQETRRSKTIN